MAGIGGKEKPDLVASIRTERFFCGCDFKFGAGQIQALQFAENFYRKYRGRLSPAGGDLCRENSILLLELFECSLKAGALFVEMGEPFELR